MDIKISVIRRRRDSGGQFLDKWIYICAHYGALLIFVVSCWGVGKFVLLKLVRTTLMEPWLAHGLSLCVGIGITICVLQALAIAGLLTAPWLIALLAIGGAAALRQWSIRFRLITSGSMSLSPLSLAAYIPRLHWTVWFLILLALGLILFPLHLPYAWDELMYHLPHAREWAIRGNLQVNEWLRYPYFPYNYHLLYAASLVLYDDVTPHLLHALAGWTTALLLYQLALRHTTRAGACIAAIAWLAMVRGEFGNAYIDMALALFLLAGWICFELWWELPSPRPSGWLLMTAFLLGIAVGIKYQMLAFLPFFAVALLLRERRPKVLVLVLAAGLLPCIYWYLRNAIITGDPFQPLGSNIFGFYDWNQADVDYQLKTVRDVQDWPHWHWLLWPAAVAPLLPSTWRHSGMRMSMAFSIYAFAVWLITSHYARYLLPSYPIFLLVAAHVTIRCFSSIASWLRKRIGVSQQMTSLSTGRVQGVVGTLLLFLAVQTTSKSLARDWDYIAATPAQRQATLNVQLGKYKETLDFLNRLPNARIYQIDMEGVIYYAPRPIYGDHFGRWRYRDFRDLNSSQLVTRMTKSGLNTLVLPTGPAENLLQARDLAHCFAMVHQDQTFKVYVIRRNGCDADLPDIVPQSNNHPEFVIGPSTEIHDDPCRN